MSSHSSQHATPRENVIKWDQYFMGIAFFARQRSKGPDFQVGACIVNHEKKVVGIGYNGMPDGVNDNVLMWGKGTTLTSGADSGHKGFKLLDSRSYFVCHAELNAIMFRTSVDVKGCTMYTTLYPCNECAKVIIQSGIAKVVYFSDDNIQDKEKYKAAKILFEETDIVIEKYDGSKMTIEVKFSNENLCLG